MPPSSVNIPGLPVGLMLTADAVFPAVQNGVDKQFTIGQLTAFAQSSAAVALAFQAPLAQSGSNVTLAGFNPATDNGVIYRASSVAIGVTAVGNIGQLLLGNGVGNPPSWLSVATTTGQLLAGTLGAAPQWISAGVTGQVLIGVTGGQPIWSSTIPGGAGVDTFSAGVTGFTPTSPTTGNVVLGGVLLPSSGGSGVTAATGSGPNVVLSTQPSLLSAQLMTPLITGQLTYGGVLLAPSVSGLGSMALTSAPSLNAPTITGALTYGGVTLSAVVTGTGAMVLQSTPTLISAVLFNASGYSAAAVVGLVNQSILGPTTRNLVSGTVATYTTPAGAKWLEVRFVGGGGGGGGVGLTTDPTGQTGGVTIFNGITAAAGVGGGGGTASTWGSGGAGGTGGAGTATLRIVGNNGGAGAANQAAVTTVGASGMGAGSHFGGATASSITSGGNGTSAVANTGAGGSGGAATSGNSASAGGGGSGEYVELIIANPSATYSYTVGTGGAGGIGTGTAPTTGGAGGSGFITVREHYNYG